MAKQWHDLEEEEKRVHLQFRYAVCMIMIMNYKWGDGTKGENTKRTYSECSDSYKLFVYGTFFSHTGSSNNWFR